MNIEFVIAPKTSDINVIFKEAWEKTSITHHLPSGTVEKMVQFCFPNRKLISYDLIAGGCANLNFKVQIENEKSPVLLRVYLRDKDAAYREQKLAALLKEKLPVPLTHFIGEIDGYTFAITEFLTGISLRDLLLGDLPHDLSEIMYMVGTTLSNIAMHGFSKAGFLKRDLDVTSYESSEIIDFAHECLIDKTVLSVLGPDKIAKIQNTINQYAQFLPTEIEKNLVHGDFDPANILVDRVNGSWVITGILDWEFSFSGSYLWDMANMLRYGHLMPSVFQKAFLEGVVNSGIVLPNNWRTTINLLNLLSLLDCLKRSDPKKSPNRCADICELIDHFLSALNMTIEFILCYLLKNYSGLKVIDTWGEKSLFYNPDNLLKRGIYFCTLKNKDGANDKASHLHRADVFRVNFGISKNTFISIFRTIPKRPVKGGVIDGDYDFQNIDILTPHPIYGWMSWVSILNPSQYSFENLIPLLDESYRICTEKYKKKMVQK
jgi:aminoglycoside phosphotransferase (APT) family kinase protein